MHFFISRCIVKKLFLKVKCFNYSIEFINLTMFFFNSFARMLRKIIVSRHFKGLIRQGWQTDHSPLARKESRWMIPQRSIEIWIIRNTVLEVTKQEGTSFTNRQPAPVGKPSPRLHVFYSRSQDCGNQENSPGLRFPEIETRLPDHPIHIIIMLN